MTTIDQLLDELRQREVTLWMEGDRLRYRAAKDALSPDLLARLKEHKAEVVAFLRQASASAGTQLPPVIAIDRKAVLPLSFAQQRLWFLHQFEPDSTSNNMPVVVHFVGSLNIEALERSLQEVVRRHEVLRTTFPAVDGQPTLLIADNVEIALPVFDLRATPEAQRQEAALQLATKEARQPFDLENGPIMRVKLIRPQDNEYFLIWNMHCIVCDGASSDVFYQNLTALYKAFINGEPSPLPALPIQYADFAHWQRQWLQGDVLRSQLDYWKQKLDGNLPVIQLPFDHPRPVGVQTYRGDRKALMLPKSLNVALTSLSQRLGATLFMTLLAAFKTLLYRYSGQEDLLVSFASAGRGQIETEGLVGFFSNTLMLRTHFEGDLTFRELLNRVRETSLEAYTYQDIPFEKLVEELRPEQSQMRSPLFQVKFALNPPWSEGRGMAAIELPDLTITSLFGYIYHGKTKYDLTLIMREQDEGLGMVFDYNADIFEDSTVARMLAHFQTLLESIVANPDRQISEMPLLTADEHYRQLIQWNGSHSSPVETAFVHQLFEAQVDQTPDAIAITFGDQSLTYRALNDRANQLAHYLQKVGVGSEVLVGVCLEPSPESIVGILGVLKAGGAYVPFAPDSHLPDVLDHQASVLLTQSRSVEKLSPQSTKIVCLDADWEIIQRESSENLSSNLAIDSLAYVSYTYVSNTNESDNAKGIRISHQSLAQLGKDSNLADPTPQDVFLHHTPLSSSASLFEIWSCLLHGSRLVIPSTYLLSPQETYLLSPQEMGQTIQDQQVTVLWLPTRLLHRLVDQQLENFGSVRQIVTGGDTLSISHAQKLLQSWKNCQLTNVYSLTENTAFAVYHRVSEILQTSISIPIGRPVANTQTYLLDQHLQPVPIGVPGELYISGNRLAQGYFNHPDLTAKHFLANPFAAETATSLYKTGDLARYLPDGNIELLGRVDRQLKIQGLQIELSRIETVLGQHPDVQEAVVLVREDLGDRALVAYVVSKREAIATHDLQSFLKQKFPAYMLPSAFVVLDNDLPLANGKIDYSKLPAPDLFNQTVEEAFAASQNEVELQLTQIWEKVLGVQPIGIRDNFFDLGGHSLLAVQLFTQIEEAFNKKLPLSTLLQKPTVEELAIVLQPSTLQPSTLQSAQQPITESLVLLRAGGSGQPFFFIHDGDGEIMLYLNLANRLNSQHPVYGIQPLSQEGFPILHSRIEEMAAYYVEKIRAVQSEGPYLIGGLCAGGVLSFEVARQLQTQGQKVALVAILDAADVQAPKRVGQVSKRRLTRFSQALSQDRSTEKQEGALDRISVIVQKIRNVLTYEVKTKLLNVRNHLEIKLYQYCLDRKLPIPQFLQNLSVRTIYTFAKEGYAPQIYQGKVVLFRAADTDDRESVVNLVSDPLFGWGRRTTDGVAVYDVPGGHASMLQEPQVEVLAEKMQTCISEALSNQISELEQNRGLNYPKTHLKSIQDAVVPR